MKAKLIIVIGLVAALVLPAGAVAKPTKSDQRNAARECKALRGSTDATREAFRASFKSMGSCVAQKAKEEATERRVAKVNAAKECKAEMADPNFASTHSNKTFADFYGTNDNDKNAFGKCVSTKAHEKKADEDAKDQQAVNGFKNAAKACDAERDDSNFASTHSNKTFADFYGTNDNDRNAFGKCVSSKARES